MENSYRFFENRDCKYFPCHKGLTEFNCLFCYCPMYRMEHCPGNPRYFEKNGRRIKDCSGCTFPHDPEHYDTIMQILRENQTLSDSCSENGSRSGGRLFRRYPSVLADEDVFFGEIRLHLRIYKASGERAASGTVRTGTEVPIFNII